MVIHHREGVDVGGQRNRIRTNGRNQSQSEDKEGGSGLGPGPVVMVPETAVVGTPVMRLRAVDEDASEENAVVTYRIASETYIPESGTVSKRYTTPHFSMDAATGEVSVASALPPETDFILNVSATDKGGLEGHTSVRIRVKDVNNHAPHFEKAWYDFAVTEGTYHDLVLGHVRATDDDFGINGNVTYSILQKKDANAELPFRIMTDGTLMVDGELDRELQEFYAFRVMARDNGEKPLHTTVDVDIRVSDLNDNFPVFYNYDKVIQVSFVRYSREPREGKRV